MKSALHAQSLLLEVLLFTALGSANLLGAPDLIIAAMDVSQVATDCQSLELAGPATATVANVGTASTGGSFTVIFFEDRNGNGEFDDATDLVLGFAVQPALAAGADAPLAANLSGVATFRGNLIHAFADAFDEIPESNEDNNYSNSGLDCEFAPSPGVFKPVVEWSWTSSSVLPDWLNVMMTPGIIDLTEDGIPDVVFG